MTYYTISLLAQLGLSLIALALIVMYYNPRKQGAAKSCRLMIKLHQHERRQRMLSCGGLPVDMDRTHGR